MKSSLFLVITRRRFAVTDVSPQDIVPSSRLKQPCSIQSRVEESRAWWSVGNTQEGTTGSFRMLRWSCRMMKF
jgi:hypothetical protein